MQSNILSNTTAVGFFNAGTSNIFVSEVVGVSPGTGLLFSYRIGLNVYISLVKDLLVLVNQLFVGWWLYKFIVRAS